MVIWKQNRAHFPHIIKNLTRIAKKDDTLNLSTMGEMKSSHFPHSTEIRYKKKDAQFPILTKYEQEAILSFYYPNDKNLGFLFLGRFFLEFFSESL